MASTPRRGVEDFLTCVLGQGQAGFRDRRHSHLRLPSVSLDGHKPSPHRCSLDLQTSASTQGALDVADAGNTDVPMSAMPHQYCPVCRPETANN